jgi:hypothetical protein
MHFLAVHERLDHREAPLELRDAHRLLADVAPAPSLHGPIPITMRPSEMSCIVA